MSARTADGAQSLSLSEVSQNAGGVVNSPAATQSTAAAANASVGADLVSARTADGAQTGTQPGSTEQQTWEMTAAEQEAAAIPETTQDILARAESILGTENLSSSERSALQMYNNQLSQLHSLQQQRAALQQQLQTGTRLDVSAARKIQSQISTLDAEIAKAETALYAAKKSKQLSGVEQKTKAMLQANYQGNDLQGTSGTHDPKALPHKTGKKPQGRIIEGDAEEIVGRALANKGISGIINDVRAKVLSLKGKKVAEVRGKLAVMDNTAFDPDAVTPDGRTNRERMKAGDAPIGYDGKSVNIHHIDQTNDGPVMEMPASVHNGNRKILHSNTGQSPSQINRSEFATWKRNYWKWRADNLN